MQLKYSDNPPIKSQSVHHKKKHQVQRVRGKNRYCYKRGGSPMILWTRREAALAAAALVSFSGLGSNDVLLQSETQQAAIFLGGFLLPASVYEVFQDPLVKLGYSVDIRAYNEILTNKDPSSSDRIPFEVLSKSPRLLLGHSKGAKTIAEWMPYWTETSMNSKRQYSPKSTSIHLPSVPAVVLIEPVDVVPPGAPSHSVLEEDWSSHLDTISRIPTLIVAAPYTQTSSRYGKAKNLCAPPGRDARAFYEVAMEARRRYPEGGAPLKYVEFEGLGHNDVVITSSQSTAIGGCGNGPDRSKGAQLVTECIVEWLSHLDA